MERNRKNCKNLNIYLENEKNFLDEIKNISQFLKGYHLVKSKSLIKIADTSFNFKFDIILLFLSFFFLMKIPEMNSWYAGVLWTITFFLSSFIIFEEMTSVSLVDKGWLDYPQITLLKVYLSWFSSFIIKLLNKL